MLNKLRGLFGGGDKGQKAYVDAGMALIHNLVTNLNLPGWTNLVPSYTAEEVEVINAGLQRFQKIADETIGEGESGSAYFHPEAAPEIRRMLTAQELFDFAERSWRYNHDDEMPSEWHEIASTYLKSWAGKLDPIALQGLADLFVKVGHRSEAKATLRVVLMFPTYADTFYAGKPPVDLVEQIVERARQTLSEIN